MEAYRRRVNTQTTLRRGQGNTGSLATHAATVTHLPPCWTKVGGPGRDWLRWRYMNEATSRSVRHLKFCHWVNEGLHLEGSQASVRAGGECEEAGGDVCM